MASALLHAPFLVLIKGGHLVVSQKTASITRTICSLDLRHKPSFYLNDGGVICRDLQGPVFYLETSGTDEAQDLLTELATAQMQHGRMKTLRRFVGLTAVVAIFGLGFIWLERDLDRADAVTAAQMVMAPIPSAAPMPGLADHSMPPPIPAPIAPEPRQSFAADTSDDGWALPESIRVTLPQKLHSAAERKLFTVDYSSGHARTLYVFADPSCPNCQRLESSLNTLSDAFNVVVFPVPVIGKEKSIAAITPVLCLPPEQRKAAWDRLFDAAPEGVNLGKAQEKPASDEVDAKAPPADACDVANKALGINQTAYQAYRIPGTPWVISDDGRYVSQALLRDPSKLQAFLDQPPANKTRETPNASQ
jgi:TrbB protein